MSLRAFFDGGTLTPGLRITLDPGESHYLVRVRRTRLGRPIEILDGRGGCWTATVDRPDPEACHCTVHERKDIPSPPRAITLLLGYPDPRATLDALTVATELAVAGVILVRCRHSHATTPSPHRIAKTLRAAQRQCGRPSPPTISGPVDFENAVPGADPAYFACERHAGIDTSIALEPGAPARLAVGPEGGFSEEESGRLASLGFRPLSLGPWVLRTETAVAAGLTRLLWA